MPLRKKTRDFTDEERKEIMQEARKTTFRKAAEKFNINLSTIKYWFYREKLSTESTNGTQNQDSLTTSRLRNIKDFTREEKIEAIQRANEIGVREAAKERGISWQALSAWKKVYKVDAAEVKKQSTETVIPIQEKSPTEPPQLQEHEEAALLDKINSLKIENVLLKEKIEVVSNQLEKLRLAIGDLAQPDVKLAVQ